MLHGVAVSSFLLQWSRQSSWYSSFHMCLIENSEMQNSKTNFYTLANTDLNTTQGTSCTHNLGTLCRQCTHNSPSKHRWKFIGVKLLSSFTNVDINFTIACTTQTWCFVFMCMRSPAQLHYSHSIFKWMEKSKFKLELKTTWHAAGKFMDEGLNILRWWWWWWWQSHMCNAKT